MINRILGTVLVGLIILIVLNVEILSYLYMQAAGQFMVLWNAEPIERILNDKEASELIKENILFIQEVKQFTEEELGMESGNLYSKVFDQQDQEILWNLTACESFQMKSFEWSFPLLGKVSYKGFFDLERAKAEEVKLKDQGFDTRIRPVNAWSTLGWFNDPILSNTLKRSKGRLAELIIHEITHKHVFLKDSVTFNENLASFIGEEGAAQFLVSKYGIESTEYKEYVALEADQDLLTSHCLKGVADLRNTYDEFDVGASMEFKNQVKNGCINKWMTELDSLPFQRMKNLAEQFLKNPPNNAFFMAFDRYSSKQKIFQVQFDEEFDKDLMRFIDYFKKKN